MKILISAIHYPVCSARYIARALRRLGHEVRTVGPATGNVIWGMEVDPRWNWEPSYHLGDAERVAFGTWPPELMITADSAYTIPNGYCPHIIWGMDNHVRDYWPDRKFDKLFLSHSWGARMCEPNAYWLPAAYDPEAHTDLGQERDIDIGLMGMLYNDRVDYLNAMVGADLKIYGNLGALWDDYNSICNHFKIAFVKSVCGDLTQRFLEGMAQGCCVLADSVADAYKLGFIPGVDYLCYDSIPDAIAKAKRALESGAWKDIAARGKEKVRPHTWDARAAEMLRVVNGLPVVL